VRGGIGEGLLFHALKAKFEAAEAERARLLAAPPDRVPTAVTRLVTECRRALRADGLGLMRGAEKRTLRRRGRYRPVRGESGEPGGSATVTGSTGIAGLASA
jgi:hypothetical protein